MKMMGNDGIPPFPPPAGSYLRAPTRNHGKVRILTRAQNPTGLYESGPAEGTGKSDPGGEAPWGGGLGDVFPPPPPPPPYNLLLYPYSFSPRFLSGPQNH